jgi:hypothetical protein
VVECLRVFNHVGFFVLCILPSEYPMNVKYLFLSLALSSVVLVGCDNAPSNDPTKAAADKSAADAKAAADQKIADAKTDATKQAANAKATADKDIADAKAAADKKIADAKAEAEKKAADAKAGADGK